MSLTQSGKVEVVVRFDGQDATSPVAARVNKVLNDLAAQHEGTVRSSGGIVEQLKAKWVGAAGAVEGFVTRLGFIGQGVAVVQGLVDKVGDLIVEGAKAADQYDTLKRSLSGLDGLIEGVQRTSKGLFSQREIVSAVSTFKSFGLELGNIDEIMAEVGKTSIRTGEDAGFLLESITKGIARLSPAILDNLQLQVSLKEINERASEATGKSTAALSKQEQQAAALAVVLDQLKKSNIDVDLENSRTTSIKRLTNAFDDLWTSAKEGLADVAVGIYDFFDQTVFGASDAELEIQRMADAFPRALGQMRAAAESELPTIKRLFEEVQREAKETQRLLGQVNETATEADDLARRIATAQSSEQVAFERSRSTLEANLKANVLSQEAYSKRITQLEDERDTRIRDRVALERQRWREEVDRHRKAEADIKVIDDEAAKRADEIASRDAERNFSIAGIIKTTTSQIETVEKSLEEARAHRDVEAVRRYQSKRLELQTYLQDLKDAEQAESGRSTRTTAAKKEDPYRLDLPRLPRANRERQPRARATEDSPFADLEARRDAAEKLARATIEGLRDFQIRLNREAIEAGDKLSIDQLRQINDRYQAAEERILDAERTLADVRVDVELDAQGRMLAIAESAEDKRARMAGRRRDEEFGAAEQMLQVTGQIGAAFIKNEKARAAWLAVVAVADGLLGYARSGDYGRIVAGVGAAVIYGAKAGGGGGGAKGIQRQESREVSTSAFDKASAGVTINNHWNAPWFGTPGEFSSYLNGVQRVGGASGIRTGGVV